MKGLSLFEVYHSQVFKDPAHFKNVSAPAEAIHVIEVQAPADHIPDHQAHTPGVGQRSEALETEIVGTGIDILLLPLTQEIVIIETAVSAKGLDIQSQNELAHEEAALKFQTFRSDEDF